MAFYPRAGASCAILVGALTVAGCNSASSLCSDVCDCEGCSDTEQEDCVDDIEDAEKRAADAGCQDQFDELVDCMDEELECRDGHVDADGCESQLKDLSDCSDGEVAAPGGSSCDAAVSICGGTPGEGEPVECTGTTQCVAQCIVSANSCDIAADVSLQGCVNDCSQ